MSRIFPQLQGDERARADKLAAVFRELGADDPEEWAALEVREDFPQLATFVLLRRLWRGIDGWRDEAAEWVPGTVKVAQREPGGAFADAAQALKRMLDAGVSVDDIGRVARMVAYEATFQAVHTLDDGYSDDAPPDAPGWVLVELGQDGEPTGRAVVGLHDCLPGVDPSGRGGRPE